MLKLFSLTFHKIYASLTKNNVSNIEISKEPNKTREPSVTCSYIWHETYQMCVLIRYTICESLIKIQYFRHEYSSILCKIRKKRNKIKRHSITCSHIWHFDISVQIKHTICKSLVKIQHFRRELSSKMYEKSIESKGVP